MKLHTNKLAWRTHSERPNGWVAHIHISICSRFHPFGVQIGFAFAVRQMLSKYTNSCVLASCRGRFSMAIKKREISLTLSLYRFLLVMILWPHIFRAYTNTYRIRMFCESSHERRQCHKKQKNIKIKWKKNSTATTDDGVQWMNEWIL